MMNDEKHQFWLYREPEDIVDKLVEFHTNWYSWHGSPFKQMWLRNYLAYYSPVLHPSAWDTSLIFEGIQGELTRFYTPKARTLIRQLTTIVTKQRLAFKAAARTSGSEVLNEVKLANALADQVVEQERLNIKGDQLCEGSLVTGVWFTKACWRTDRGEKYVTDDRGQPILNGGVEVSLLSPFNVYYNMLLPWDQLPWAACRVKRNKWDLIAEHPELEDEIIALPSVSSERGPYNWVDSQLDDEDLIYVYEFYHKPSPALPKGKMIIYANRETIFYAGDNKYGTIPIEPNIPEAVLDTGMGYAKLTDLAGCQEMFDNGLSAIATNQSQFAVQNVATPRGSNINVQELNGMRFLSYTPQNVPGGGMPQPLQLTKSAPESFKFNDKLEELMQDMSFINGAMTGNLPAGVSSGTAIATLSANSIEFITSISKSYNLCWEKTMMHVMNAYQRFAHTEHEVKLVGRGGQVSHKPFSKDDIQNVHSMTLEIVNPILKTFAGRFELGEKFIATPEEKWADYAAIMNGEPLESLYKGKVTEDDLITQENESLEEGVPVTPLASDDHPLHIKKHTEILADVGTRQNGEAVQAVLDHIMQHYQLVKSTDPFLMALMKTGRIPEGGIPQGGGGMPPPGGPAPGGGRPKPAGPQPVPPEQDKPGGPSVDEPGKAPGIPPGDVAQPAQDLLQRRGGM